MDKFARLWPDVLATEAAERDLEYEPYVALPKMVAHTLAAHAGRRAASKAAFRSIDACESGRINDYMLVEYVRKYLSRGKERPASSQPTKDLAEAIVAEAMVAMDKDTDGRVSFDDFVEWSRTNDVENMVDDFVAQRERDAEQLAAAA